MFIEITLLSSDGSKFGDNGRGMELSNLPGSAVQAYVSSLWPHFLFLVHAPSHESLQQLAVPSMPVLFRALS